MRIRREHQLPTAHPTLERRFGLMAEGLLFRTNDAALLAAAETSFGRFPVPADDGRPLTVELYCEDDAGEAEMGGRGITHRIHDDLYVITGGSRDIAMVDVVRGTAVGFVSRATVADEPTVRYAYLEAMGLSMLARGRGYLTIHAAGVVRDGVGVVIGGPAGAGKSTLAMACARRGFGVFAEDAVFVRIRPSGLELWGVPWTQRLLPDARGLFPELADFDVGLRPNGELKIEVDLDAVHPGRAVPCAMPGPIVFLERGSGGSTRVEALDASDERVTLEVHWPWDRGWTADHELGAERLGAAGFYRLHMNGSPDEAVDALEAVLDGLERPTVGR